MAGSLESARSKGEGWTVATAESRKAIVAAAPRELTERLDRLLLRLATRHPTGGEQSEVETEDYPLGYRADGAEYVRFVQQLQAQGILERTPEGWPITARSWERSRDLRRNVIDTTQAFVAIWFSKERDEPYEKAIEPALLRAGCRPLRIDGKPHSNRIDDEIVLEIE